MTRLIRTFLRPVVRAGAVSAATLFGGTALLAFAITANAQITNAPTVQPMAALPAFTHPATVPADLARVDAALNGTGTFSGRFTQYGADGSFAQGSVAISRPGRMRFEYDDPNPLLIVSDGVTLVQHDKALETYDRVPLSATPLNYFLKEDVNLANDTEVIAFQKVGPEWRVTSRDGSGQLDGAITMVFDAATLNLREWVIVDEFGGQTRVVLSDLRYNERLDPRQFILREDSNRRDRRRR